MASHSSHKVKGKIKSTCHSTMSESFVGCSEREHRARAIMEPIQNHHLAEIFLISLPNGS